jgi:hypothetical protein
MTQTASFTEFTKRTFREMMKDVATSIPGHVLAFDTVTQRAQIQIGIIRKDVNGVEFTPPPIIEVPVHFSGGKLFHLEHQIDPNDEGIILFSQRCIDGWVATGGVANNPILRFHDISDAVFITGVRSEPNVITTFGNDGIRLRNADGTQHVWLKNDGSIIVANSNGGYTLDAGGGFTGNFTSFNVVSPTFTHNGVNVGDDHKHVAGTYVAGATPVTNNSGDPLP